MRSNLTAIEIMAIVILSRTTLSTARWKLTLGYP
jgi:hypothetical protein